MNKMISGTLGGIALAALLTGCATTTDAPEETEAVETTPAISEADETCETEFFESQAALYDPTQYDDYDEALIEADQQYLDGLHRQYAWDNPTYATDSGTTVLEYAWIYDDSTNPPVRCEITPDGQVTADFATPAL